PGGPPVRLGDHQVAVERQRGVLEQRLDDGQPEGEGRHEVVVHDVHVQPVRGGGDRGGLVGEPGEVSGQDARRDLNGHNSPESRGPECGRDPPMRKSSPGWHRRNVVWRGYSSILSSTGSTWRLHMHSDPPSALLDRVRKLLAKAEAEGVTPPEAGALTAKAAELMARYGIDRARLAATRPDTDRPGSRIIDIDNPWA